MKVIITKNQQDKVAKLVRSLGCREASKIVGGINVFLSIFKTPIDFLHIYDGMEVVDSVVEPNFTLFRFEEGKNIMAMLNFKKSKSELIIHWDLLVEVLKYVYKLSDKDCVTLLYNWAKESYDLTNFVIVVRESLQDGGWLVVTK